MNCAGPCLDREEENYLVLEAEVCGGHHAEAGSKQLGRLGEQRELVLVGLAGHTAGADDVTTAQHAVEGLKIVTFMRAEQENNRGEGAPRLRCNDAMLITLLSPGFDTAVHIASMQRQQQQRRGKDAQ